MALNERTSTLSFEFRRTSIERDQKEHTQPSMIYSLLPTVVQNRIPTLPSIRRSVSDSVNDFRGRSGHIKNFSASTDATALSESPPPSYTSRPGTATPGSESITSLTPAELDLRDDISEMDPTSSFCSLPPAFTTLETESGINWKYANQGISMLSTAYHESSSLTRGELGASSSLARNMYLNGLHNLLRGLPERLEPEELLSLQTAIPETILNSHGNSNAHALIPISRQGALTHEGSTQEPSVLHRITAAIVFQTFIMIQFLLPYVKLLLGHAYRFERDHKVTQRVFNNTITTVDSMGRRSLRFTQTVCQMNDGKVGQAINDLTFWWVRGITGGIQQGVSEGIVMIGAERNQASKGRVEKIE